MLNTTFFIPYMLLLIFTMIEDPNDRPNKQLKDYKHSELRDLTSDKMATDSRPRHLHQNNEVKVNKRFIQFFILANLHRNRSIERNKSVIIVHRHISSPFLSPLYPFHLIYIRINLSSVGLIGVPA